MAVSLPFQLVKLGLSIKAQLKRQAFIEACKNPAYAQQALKDKILANAQIPFPDGPTTYQDYADILSLTKEPVRFYETTSGSTGTKKKIPYTKSLLKSFENMFLLWAHDLVFHSGLNLKSGKFFMSVSPQIGSSVKDDRQYLSPFLSFLLNPFLASNPNQHKANSSHEFFLKISRDLINSPDLEIISVWSPTYFLSVLDFMEREGMKPHWPKLKLISCWNSAQAEASAKVLQAKFPGVKIQGKGLLLTEAPITIPWSEAGGDLPLLTETYLEFLDQQGKIHPLHELKVNEKYVVLTSQQNGFLRYNTLDEVQVTGFYYKTPILKFLGRTGNHSDLAGEKLSDSILWDLFKKLTYPLLIVPNQSENLPFYQVYTEGNINVSEVETLLCENYHYQLARELNQLKSPKLIQIHNLRQKYLEFYQSQGMQLGDIKERILINDSLQAEKFRKWIEQELQSSPRDSKA
jgi:hypothetical protein